MGKSVLASLIITTSPDRLRQLWNLGRRDRGQNDYRKRNACDLREQAKQKQKAADDFKDAYEMRCEIGIWKPDPSEP